MLRKANPQSLPESIEKMAPSVLKIDPQMQMQQIENSFGAENMFFPVLGIKKTMNQYQKKMMRKKQNYLSLNAGKKELFKSQHFKNASDDEMGTKLAKKYLKNPRVQVSQRFKARIHK